jgi:hypothetical protein
VTNLFCHDSIKIENFTKGQIDTIWDMFHFKAFFTMIREDVLFSRDMKDYLQVFRDNYVLASSVVETLNQIRLLLPDINKFKYGNLNQIKDIKISNISYTVLYNLESTFYQIIPEIKRYATEHNIYLNNLLDKDIDHYRYIDSLRWH